MGFIFLALNLLILLLWARTWVKTESSFYFNPYLSGAMRLVNLIIGKIRPALLLPEQATACVLLAVALVLKGLLCVRFSFPIVVLIGPFLFRMPSSVLGVISFSILQGALTLVQLWAVYAVLQFVAPPFRKTSRALDAFAFFMRPFSFLPLGWFLPALVLAHTVLCVLLPWLAGSVTLIKPELQQVIGVPALTDLSAGPLFALCLRLAILVVLSLFQCIPFILHFLVVLIIISFVSSFFNARNASQLAMEGLAMVLGRFYRTGRIGTFWDLTPLFAIIGLGLLHTLVMSALCAVYGRIG